MKLSPKTEEGINSEVTACFLGRELEINVRTSEDCTSVSLCSCNTRKVLYLDLDLIILTMIVSP